MDPSRFDALTRSLAFTGTRRGVLKGLLGLGGVATGVARIDDAGAARRGYSGPPVFQPQPTPAPNCPPDTSSDCEGFDDGCPCANATGQCVQQTCRYPCPNGSAHCWDNPIAPAPCCRSFGALGLFCDAGPWTDCTCNSRKSCELAPLSNTICCHDAASPIGGYCRGTFVGCDPFGE